ncbi:MAG TPA: hypothetical protein VGI11_08020, partial [Variovorax sp.]|jgi:hypothetical protein
MTKWAAPTPGDIVWCRFPNLPRRSPGPKPRPALVCGVTEREDGVAVTVAYGSSQGLNRLYGGEFAITKQGAPAAYSSAGLSFDTKFDFRQRVELPWNEDFFGVPPHAPHGQHPKLGSLHASMMRAAQAALQAAN